MFNDYYFNNQFCAVEDGFETWKTAQAQSTTIEAMMQRGLVSTLETALAEWICRKASCTCGDDKAFCEEIIMEIQEAI